VNSLVKFQPDAGSDVADAAAWYENQRKGLGAEFLDEILSTCEVISENPKLFPVVHRNTRRAVIKKFPFGIYYRTEDDFVSIIAVMHGSRDPKSWKNRT
jgi:plasmid stabilization system protein ParE